MMLERTSWCNRLNFCYNQCIPHPGHG